MGERKYNIKHRKVRSQYMVYTEIDHFIKDNWQHHGFKSASDFANHLYARGIQSFKNDLLNEVSHDD